jgi:hypothetical protein
MKGAKFLFGFFFISLGLLTFIDNFNHIHGTEELWRLWPVILILLGVASLINYDKLKNIMMAGIGIISALTIFSSMQDAPVYVADYHNEKAYSTNDTSLIAFDSTLSDTTFLSIGAGVMNINLMASDDTSLMMISSQNEFFQRDDEDSQTESLFSIDKIIKNGTMHLDVDMGGNIKMFRNNKLKKADFRLNKKPIWNIALAGGVNSFNADVSKLRISNFSFDIGVSDISLKLGDLIDSSHVEVNGGAVTKFHIEIPEGVGCKIDHESVLTKHNFPGFIQKDDQSYETPNYQSSRKKITINLETGISSIMVKTYKQNPPISPSNQKDEKTDTLLKKLDIKPNKQSKQL